MNIQFTLVALILLISISANSYAAQNTLTIQGEQILFNGEATKVIGLRCSNALLSDKATDDLIAALNTYQSYGINTISVFLMGSRFGDIKGYLPDSSLNPIYRDRFERILHATGERGMICIVGCLYWSTSKANDDLSHWSQSKADKAIANTASWLAERKFIHVILDPDNEGMAVRANQWSVESMIRAAKKVNPTLVVANNTKQNPHNEDINMHFGEYEKGKPWFDSEATPNETPGNYWGAFSKKTHQANGAYYNYSRIGRYTEEMKLDYLKQTRDEIENFNGYVFASTWLQCGPNEGVNGPFTQVGGYSNLGSNEDRQAEWNQDIDTIHPDAGILWWLEFIKQNYAK